MLVFFFFNDTATTEIYTLSLHDALPIYLDAEALHRKDRRGIAYVSIGNMGLDRENVHGSCPLGPELAQHEPCFKSCDVDRKSTRLNSSHANISYAVFCLKKKQ